MLKKIFLIYTCFFSISVVAMEREKQYINIKAVGVAHEQGRRPTMEDKDSINLTASGQILGIYDGHGGADVAEYVSRELPKNLENKLDRLNPDKALKYAFEMTDANLRKSSLKKAAKSQGTTAIIILKMASNIYAANVGDSRAVLSRKGKAIALSEDHKPNRADEKERIEELGGKVIVHGVPRVQGNLAISRSIGDHELTPYVIPTPEINRVTLTEDDEFLILACDGIFDVMNNQEAVNIVKKSLTLYGSDSKAEKEAANDLVKAAYDKGSNDNLSVMVATLKRSSTKPEEKIPSGIIKRLREELYSYAWDLLKSQAGDLVDLELAKVCSEIADSLIKINKSLKGASIATENLIEAVKKLVAIQKSISTSEKKNMHYNSPLYGSITLQQFSEIILNTAIRHFNEAIETKK